MDLWIQWINKEVKVDCVLTLANSEGLAIVRYGSTRSVDLVVLNFSISRVGSVEGTTTQKSRYAKPRCDLDHQIMEESGPLICGEEIS
jgi:hypothetical protein